MPNNMMMFAEEDTPVTPPADPTPVDPTPAEPVEPVVPAEPVVPTELAPVDPVTPAEPALEDPHKQKIDALQNSLDVALEELGKGDTDKPAEPTPVEPVAPVAPEPVVPEPIKPAPITAKSTWETEMKAIKERQDSFENTTAEQLEQMQLKDEMIGLTSEIQAAITQYPNADSNRILLEIESGSDKTVATIAKEQNDQYQTLVDKISKEQEEKIKTALDKENEGNIKVPQSSGTSSTPSATPDQPGAPVQTKTMQDAVWASATKAAKANLQ